eukprot:scaffold38943_cov55-Phaeocystis_antarctica.AAC.3
MAASKGRIHAGAAMPMHLGLGFSMPMHLALCASPRQKGREDLDGQRRWNQRLGRQLAGAPERLAGHPVGRPLPGRAELP